MKIKRLFLFLGFNLFSYLLLILAVLVYLNFTAPDLNLWKKKNPSVTAYMEYKYRGKKRKPPRISWVPLKQIPQLFQRTVVVAEDASFWGHHGIDWFEVKASLEKNVEKGKFLRGGSTLTQQVVKNLYLTPEKSVSRKIKEWILAIKLDRTLSKRRILEIYFNIVEWGPGIFGVKAAAGTYFHKTPAELDLDEMVRLAAVLPNPIRLNPVRMNYSVYWRSKTILRRLVRFRFINEAEYQNCLATLNYLYNTSF